MICRQFLPNFLEYFDQLIKGSYLADLDAFFSDESLVNSGIVAKQIVFPLIKELYSFGNQFKDLITFLKTALDQERPPLHIFDRFNDQYLRLRIEDQSYKIEIVQLSYIEMQELGGNNDFNWINATHLEESSIQELQIQDQSSTPSQHPVFEIMATVPFATVTE